MHVKYIGNVTVRASSTRAQGAQNMNEYDWRANIARRMGTVHTRRARVVREHALSVARSRQIVLECEMRMCVRGERAHEEGLCTSSAQSEREG